MHDDSWDEEGELLAELATEPLTVGELTFAERELVESSVDDTNAAYIKSTVDLALYVRDLVIGRIFRGDYAAFSDRNPFKTRTFAAYIQHERLVVGKQTIYYLIRVGEQARQFRSEVALGLSFTHHKCLLPVKDLAVREQLAEQAYDGQWPVEDLAAAVKRVLPEKPDRAPPRTQPVVLDSLRATRQDLLKKVTAERIRREWTRMTPAQQDKTAAWVKELEARAAELAAVLEDLRSQPGPDA